MFNENDAPKPLTQQFMATDAKLVFDNQAEGWTFKLYHSKTTLGWWVDCIDMQYAHGLVTVDKMLAVLSNILIHTLGDCIDDGAKLKHFKKRVKESVLDWEPFTNLIVLDENLIGVLNLLFLLESEENLKKSSS